MSTDTKKFEISNLTPNYGCKLVSTNSKLDELLSQKYISLIKSIVNERGVLLVRGLSSNTFINEKNKTFKEIPFFNGKEIINLSLEKAGRKPNTPNYFSTQFWHCDTYFGNGLFFMYKATLVEGESDTSFARYVDVLPIYMKEANKLLKKMKNLGFEESEGFVEEMLNQFESKGGKFDLIQCYYEFLKENKDNIRDGGDIVQAIKIFKEINKRNYSKRIKTGSMSDLSNLLGFFPEYTQEFRNNTINIPNSYRHKWELDDLIIQGTSDDFLHRKIENPTNADNGYIFRYYARFAN